VNRKLIPGGFRYNPGRIRPARQDIHGEADSGVEDQEDNRQILRDLLNSAGFDMVEAEDGQQAVVAADKHRPDVILMDIQLPILDGYEATRRIKANPELKAIPIIVVTSYALSGDEGKARDAGCDAYVTKPYSPRQLLAKIREYLP